MNERIDRARKVAEKIEMPLIFSAAYDIDVFSYYQRDNSSSTGQDNSLSPLEYSNGGV